MGEITPKNEGNMGSSGTFLFFFHVKNSEGYHPPPNATKNMALFLGWLVGWALKARELHLFPKDREIGVDAVDGEVHEKSWPSIFLGKFLGERNYVKMIIQKLRFFLVFFFVFFENWWLTLIMAGESTVPPP